MTPGGWAVQFRAAVVANPEDLGCELCLLAGAEIELKVGANPAPGTERLYCRACAKAMVAELGSAIDSIAETSKARISASLRDAAAHENDDDDGDRA